MYVCLDCAIYIPGRPLMGSPQTVLMPFLSRCLSPGLTQMSWCSAPVVPAHYCPCPSLPILPITRFAHSCPCSHLSLPVTHWSGIWGSSPGRPLAAWASWAYPPHACLDLDFYCLAILPSLPACNFSGRSCNLDSPSLGSPPPHYPGLLTMHKQRGDLAMP